MDIGPPKSPLPHPYRHRPPTSFWNSAVREAPLDGFTPLVEIPFRIRRTDRVASAGSCFAQHLSRALIGEGIRFVQEESADDAPASPRAQYSARYGNIYTTRQLRQLLRRAYGLYAPQHRVWQRDDGRYVDPFRPTEFAAGFASEAEVAKAARVHLAAVRRVFEGCDVFVFTLGLTEAWIGDDDGAAFPLPPGVLAAPLDAAMAVSPRNLSVDAMTEDLLAFIDDMRHVTPDVRFIFTVSPVPMIATFNDRHVLVSNTYSKAALRVVAQIVSERRPGVFYFPSYEMIAAHPKAAFYEDDLRSVSAEGVESVMKVVRSQIIESAAVTSEPLAPLQALPQPAPVAAKVVSIHEAAKIICDEEMLAQPAVIYA